MLVLVMNCWQLNSFMVALQTNQQRGRRYRSGQEKEIEAVFYGAMQQQRSMNNLKSSDEDSENPLTGTYSEFSTQTSSEHLDGIQEVEPGRFAGTFQTSSPTHSETNGLGSSPFDLDFDDYMRSSEETTENENTTLFHSNAITPGTTFFENFTARLEEHIRKKLECDPKWAHLTVILSGPNVPGEG